jgi:hypothetical protein
LAEAGRYQEALACIQQHLCTTPDDAEALNDAGAILHCLGRTDEAVAHFGKARSFQNNSPEIIWNLVEAYLALGRADEAARLFDDMERMRILNVDVLNRTANVFLNQGNKADAVEILLRSLRFSPNQEVLKPMLEVIRSKRPKIAFFCGGDGMTFLNDIADFTKQRFNVRIFQGRSEQDLYELMKWSDISWFEWCTDLAVVASKLPKVCENIIRLHRYEAYGQWPKQINWDNIDVLITVGNSFVRDALLKQTPFIENNTQVVTVPNGLDLNRFKFVDRGRGKNLACVGHINLRKNPMFILQCMQKLHYIDPQYKLFIAGDFQDPTLEQYVRYMINALGLADVVLLVGWQQDINSWLSDKHYIISSSIAESQGMSLVEGMACGLKPVIHNFPGADQIFPSEFLFNISEDFCRQVVSDKYEPQRYRRFVEENYSLENQLAAVNGIFKRFEAEIDSQQPAAQKQNNCEILVEQGTFR